MLNKAIYYKNMKNEKNMIKNAVCKVKKLEKILELNQWKNKEKML